MKYTTFIGLGSNLASTAGTPAETVQAGIQVLSEMGGLVAQSSLYRTSPVGYREQPHFINAVVCLQTELEPESLLQEMLALERKFGRERRQSLPKGPRTLDLDLLLVMEAPEDIAVLYESPALTLPHPEIPHRRFVLEPLAEIAPELFHPVLHKTMKQLLEELLDKSGDTKEEVTRL